MAVQQPAKSRGPETDPQIALLRSQSGPLASAPFINLPTDKVSRIDSWSFRFLVLRCLRQPLPLTFRSCRCGRLLDSPWPSSVCVSSCWGVGSSWISTGERGSTNLPRTTRKGWNECFRSRSRFACDHHLGREETRSCRGRFAPVPGRAAHN